MRAYAGSTMRLPMRRAERWSTAAFFHESELPPRARELWRLPRGGSRRAAQGVFSDAALNHSGVEAAKAETACPGSRNGAARKAASTSARDRPISRSICSSASASWRTAARLATLRRNARDESCKRCQRLLRHALRKGRPAIRKGPEFSDGTMATSFHRRSKLRPENGSRLRHAPSWLERCQRL